MTEEIQKIPLNILNIEESDLTAIEIDGQPKQVLDLKSLKSKRGNEYCSIEDSKHGIIIQCQSFKHDLEKVKEIAYKLFNDVKSKDDSKRQYIQ